MGVGVILQSGDIEAGIRRCRQLGIDRVAVSRDCLPGFDLETYSGVPDGELLSRFVERFGEAGVEVAAVSKPYCMGKDPEIVRDPRAHRREIEEMLATIEVVASANIPTMLQYVHVAEPEDPAEDELLWGNVGEIFREVAAQAEASRLRLANHGRWPTPDAGTRRKAREAGITYEDYRRFRVGGWEGPFMVRNGEHIGRLVEVEAPNPYHGVCLCTGMYMNGTDVMQATRRFLDKIFFVQPRDLKGRWPGVEEVMPGEGELDLKELLRTLAQAGYQGLVHPEHFEDTGRSLEDPEAEAVKTIAAWIEEAGA
jgi:sugar phosphate isomerase/epimerase